MTQSGNDRDISTSFKRLKEMTAPEMEAVDTLIKERMASRHAPLIQQLSAHLIEAGGKRLRPILTIAAAQLCNYQDDHHVKLAATVEFIHTATLLHDDVVDESDLRRGRKSANILWGPKPSILVGDYLFSRSFQLMVETDSIRVLGILSDASAVIAEGEVLQLSTANNLSTSLEQYYQVIRAKTAALFSAATQVGAVISKAPTEQEKALYTYGDALGVAFQLADDILDYGGASASLGKNTGDDFREGKVTMPILLAYNAGDATEKEFWKRCIEKRKQNDDDLATAMEIMQKHDTMKATADAAHKEAARAKEALQIFEPSPLRYALEDIADYCVSRTV